MQRNFKTPLPNTCAFYQCGKQSRKINTANLWTGVVDRDEDNTDGCNDDW